MPSLTLESGVSFSYTDSAVPESNKTDYVTLLLIHGGMFHNGNLAAIGSSNHVRVIALNRREYPGSSPYSPQELDLLTRGSEAQKSQLLAEMGRDLALFIAGVAASLSLPGSIAVVGWSVGSLMVLSIAASMDMLPEDARQTLTTSVRSMILFRHAEGPSVAYGMPDPEGIDIPPMMDLMAADADQESSITRWLLSFFAHGDLSKHDPRNLQYNVTDSIRLPTIPMDGITDFTASTKYDGILISPRFHSVTAKLLDKSLFDSHVRGELWKDTEFFVVTGSADSWTTIYASWKLEERMRMEAKPECKITFKMIEGANHFFMIEDPQGAVDCFKACII
ncbi:unnamed protein product [Mycena citricolor]|uniref:AB hydrolase-1 domain-containing protein n=1 Tax=Mycena citricolor TaxID=2018698 RepID=A0AAD2K781_9AGAR|nr:unnamed protein product [Mycena citricolor]